MLLLFEVSSPRLLATARTVAASVAAGGQLLPSNTQQLSRRSSGSRHG